MTEFITPTLFAEYCCLFVAAICVYNDKHIIWRGMFAFLLFICITEVIGTITGTIFNNNNKVYNLFIIAEASVNGAMFVYLIQQYVKIYKFHIAALFVLCFTYLYEIDQHGFYVFNSVTTSIMSVLFIAYGLYFYYLLIKDANYINLKNYAPFWWVAGSLLFYYGSSVSTLYFAIFKTQRLWTYRSVVYHSFNIILYGSWSYSFICRYRQRKLIH